LQKALADAGPLRRAAEAMIAAGRVTVDGSLARSDSGRPGASGHHRDGRRIGPVARHIYLALDADG
jgi:16S rRNA U516 pseudouridylate synthase RsuA-like enzyme